MRRPFLNAATLFGLATVISKRENENYNGGHSKQSHQIITDKNMLGYGTKEISNPAIKKQVRE